MSMTYLEELRKSCEDAKAEIAKLPDWCQTNLQERFNETAAE